MKKTLILFFGLLMFTTSIFPLGLSVDVMPCNVFKEVLKEGPCLPTYVPGTVKLDALDPSQGSVFAEVPFVPTKRFIFYGITYNVLELAYDHGEEFVALLEKDKANPKEPEVMVMVNFVKYYNIPKADFEKAIKAEYQSLIRLGLDPNDEENEVPNPDIVYTFNNTIIDYYYRRA